MTNARTGGDLISVVVPVFNEAEIIRTFHERTSMVLNGLNGMRHELIFIDDGSSDGSYEILRELARADASVRVLRFSRNFGSG